MEAGREIAGMVRSEGLEMQQGRKLLSLQSPQERSHNSCGNHQPGCERWGKGKRQTDKEKIDRTRRRKDRGEITKKRGRK